jgi:hypothetical protein
MRGGAENVYGGIATPMLTFTNAWPWAEYAVKTRSTAPIIEKLTVLILIAHPPLLSRSFNAHS